MFPERFLPIVGYFTEYVARAERMIVNLSLLSLLIKMLDYYGRLAAPELRCVQRIKLTT